MKENAKTTISEQDIELISASLDGQLDTQQQAAFKRRLLQEPELNAQYQTFKQLDQKIKTAISDIDNTKLPKKLAATVSSGSISWGRYLISAAAVGLLAINIWHFNSPLDPLSTAQVDISEALNQTPTMTPIELNANRQMIVLNSYTNQQNNWCRHYQWQDSKQQVEAFACLEHSKWQIKNQQIDLIDENNQYQTASDTQSSISFYIQQQSNLTRLNAKQEQNRLKKHNKTTN